MSFKSANLVTGWSVFLISTIAYFLTLEPTTSFWDCGEFITTAYKLEIGHPPGAPLFMLLGRLFSAFVSTEMVAVSINVLSCVCSGLTVLFLFWTITHFAAKISNRGRQGVDGGNLIAVMAAGAVGALAYAFSDSFWFSAAEGEVYAMSSLFTAAVFWSILRWESLSDGRSEMRYIVLIAYLMGLSIGVHLLNLLAIPAICFVFYFKRFEVSRKGLIYTGLVSIVILGLLQSIIIPGVVSTAGRFEKLFVNSLGLPFNTGVIFYILLVAALLVFGLIYTHRRNLHIFNTAVLAVVMIIMGYSTYAVIVIRSSANPPLDENNPENVFTLLSYLNREQYGDRPLLFGQYWNSPPDPSTPRLDGDPVYAKAWVVENGAGRTIQWFTEKYDAEDFVTKSQQPYKVVPQYVVSDERKGTIINYDTRFTDIFPRMYSSQDSHVSAYESWSDHVGKPIRVTGQDGPTIINKPTFTENLRFFFRYQVNWMYWRYFMWNFAGKQNDIQGHGGLMEGNWISGIDVIDNERLASQENLPSTMKNNFGYNKFFFIPLILGLLGLLYQLYRRPDDWFVTLLLFLFTGLAIVVYLNQTPYQPRERDYAYAGSFYAFAIWIGLGVYALFDAAFNLSVAHLKKAAMYGLGGVVAVLLLEQLQGSNHHFSFALLFMVGSILIGLTIMTFVGRKTNNSVLAGVLALLIGLPAPIIMAAEGWDDHNRSHRYTARDFAANYLESCEPNAILFTNGDNDTFPLWYAQEVEGIRTDVRVVNLSLLNTDWYINQMKRKAYDSEPVPLSLEETKYRQGTRDVVYMDDSRNTNQVAVSVDQAMAFIANDANLRAYGKDKIAVFPTKNFFIPVDKELVLANGTVQMADSARVVDQVEWKINRSYLLKNNLMQLDLFATNDWERPIYFAVTTGPDSYINLDPYFELVGLAYRLVPIKQEPNPNPNIFGTVDTEKMYTNVMEKFKWGGMDSDRQIYMDENNLRMTNNIRLQFANLAEQLIVEEKMDKAVNVLDECVRVMPDHNVPFDKLMVPIVQNYYRTGEDEKANAILEVVFDRYAEELEYYLNNDLETTIQLRQEIQTSFAVLQRLHVYVTRMYPQESLREKIDGRFQELDASLQQSIQEMESYRTLPKTKF